MNIINVKLIDTYLKTNTAKQFFAVGFFLLLELPASAKNSFTYTMVLKYINST